jgi:pyoverdine/dityrosine biosynthesis protein Dit1
METSEYIYPFSPFQDLTRKKKQWKITRERSITTADIRGILDGLAIPKPKISGDTPEERVLSILRDDEYRLGPLTFHPERQLQWLERIRTRTSRRLPVELCLLACPFKAPVPLKTDRKLADMGEALLLHRLHTICKLIGEVYEPGATATVVTEGLVGKFTGVPKATYTAYRRSVEELLALLGYGDHIRIHDLEQIETAVPRFSSHWISHYVKLNELFNEGDPHFMEEFRGAYRSMVRMMDTTQHPEKVLMDVYDFNIAPDRLAIKARKVRQSILVEAKDAVLWLRAFLRARDEVRYLEKVSPAHLKLTVSLKPEDPGVFAVNRRTMILPYHGVPVYQVRRGDFTVEYLTNLKRSRRPYEVVYLEGDKDPAPFYYETR